MPIKGHHMGGGNNNNISSSPPPPELVAVAMLSDLEPTVSFVFGGKEDVDTEVGYTKLVSAILNHGCILVLLVLS